MLREKLSIDNIDELTDISGIDVYYIGIYDLSASLGLPGEVENPRFYLNLKKWLRKLEIVVKLLEHILIQ